jgi:hypothetical protein
VVQVEVVAGQVGEVVGGEPLDLFARLVVAAGLTEQHGERRPPAEVGREPVDEAPEGRLQLG